MTVLSFTTVFPNPRRPLFGLFVRERLRYASRFETVHVVAPVPWFHRFSPGPTIPEQDVQQGLPVDHPTFWYSPGFPRLNPFFLYRSAFARLRELHNRQLFDLLDAHFGWPDGVTACMMGERLRLPVVVTLRGSELFWSRYPPARAAMSAWLPRCSRVIAVSPELAELALSLGVAAARTTVIENGVDTSTFTPGDCKIAREQLGLDYGSPLIVSVGHLVPGKGFHRLVEAFADVVRDFPTARLAILGGTSAGSGTYPTELRRLVARLRLERQVLLPGAVSKDQVVAWLRASDLFVLFSEREGSPNVVWEALACGKPVVATEVGDIPRMVPSFAGSTLPATASRGVLAGAVRNALTHQWDGVAIRTFAEEHDWATVATRVHEAWRAAVPPSASRRGA